jgi:hypothetical protein
MFKVLLGYIISMYVFLVWVCYTTINEDLPQHRRSWLSLCFPVMILELFKMINFNGFGKFLSGLIRKESN